MNDKGKTTPDFTSCLYKKRPKAAYSLLIFSRVTCSAASHTNSKILRWQGVGEVSAPCAVGSGTACL